MSQTTLGLSALTLELAAWGQLAVAGNSDAELALYYACHAGASVLLALLAWGLLPPGRKQPRLPLIGLLFALIFFVPVFGFLGVAATLLALPLLPRFAPQFAFRSVGLPALDPHERTSGMGFRQAGLRSFLSNPQAPLATRLRALVTLQNVPTRVSSSMLRDLLADPAEDLRLLAYGMLDAQEKKLNAQIHDALQTLAAGGREAERAQRRLAQLYWEMVYRRLAEGDLRAHALDQALRHGRACLERAPGDPGLQLLLGRLLHEAGDAAGADAAYRAALAHGIPPPRVLPYLAELAFEAQRFDEVRRIVALLREWGRLQRLEPVLRFWGVR
jgi:tetratricopeptide (TPR) repeat protein